MTDTHGATANSGGNRSGRDAMLEDASRSMFALAAETGDHAWRCVEDATLTAMLIARARTPIEAFEILKAYQHRAIEEQTQHIRQIAAVYARAIEAQMRSFQMTVTRT